MSSGGEQDGWRLEPHVCGDCFGRIVSKIFEADGEAPRGRRFMCSNCGNASGDPSRQASRTAGVLHPVICACAYRIQGRDAGVRCVRNDKASPEFPSLFIAREVG